MARASEARVERLVKMKRSSFRVWRSLGSSFWRWGLRVVKIVGRVRREARLSGEVLRKVMSEAAYARRKLRRMLRRFLSVVVYVWTAFVGLAKGTRKEMRVQVVVDGRNSSLISRRRMRWVSLSRTFAERRRGEMAFGGWLKIVVCAFMISSASSTTREIPAFDMFVGRSFAMSLMSLPLVIWVQSIRTIESLRVWRTVWEVGSCVNRDMRIEDTAKLMI